MFAIFAAPTAATTSISKTIPSSSMSRGRPRARTQVKSSSTEQSSGAGAFSFAIYSTPVTPTLTIRGFLRATLPSEHLLVIELTKVVDVPRPVSRKLPRYDSLVSCSRFVFGAPQHCHPDDYPIVAEG
jgi:hypothetical protein